MKNLYLIFGTALILSSCGNSDSQKDIFVDSCLSSSPGGNTYVEFCECSWNETLKLMSEAETTAMRRDWSEIQDQQAAMRFPFQSAQAGQTCADKLIYSN